MLEAIGSATRTINFATYVYWTGSIAPEFAEALAERAEAGVEVNVLLDAVGAAKMDRGLIDRLEEAGAKVAWFRPPKWYTLHKLNNRTHRKILVIDGRVGLPRRPRPAQAHADAPISATARPPAVMGRRPAGSFASWRPHYESVPVERISGTGGRSEPRCPTLTPSVAGTAAP
jgi:hypothetical protein